MKRALTTALLAAGALAGAAAGLPAAAAGQPPAELRWELVSPLESRGFDWTRTRVGGSRDHVPLFSSGSDVNGVYPSTRTPDGWKVGYQSLTPPNGSQFVASDVEDLSDDASRAVVRASKPGAQVTDRLALGLPDGSWRIIGAGLSYVDRTPDARRLIVKDYVAMQDPDEVYPGLPGRETGVFVWEDDGTDDGVATAVGTDVPRILACGATVGDGIMHGFEQTGVSEDTRTVVLQSKSGACGQPSHVFLWRDGVTTDISAPDSGDGAATYVGSATDLSAVFFRTALALDPADANGAADVYRYDVATGTRTRLTGAATDAGETLGDAISSDDGGRLWFSTQGDDDLHTLWVATGDAAARAISTVRNTATFPFVPFPLVNTPDGPNTTAFPAQLTSDGATLVWPTRVEIDGAGGGAVGSDAGQLFRATADGDVDCISCFADGSPARQPVPGPPEGGLNRGNRVISDDGRWIYFQTTSALEPDDRNGVSDIYVWHDGVRSLLTPGEEGVSAELGGVTGAGDAIVLTDAILLPWIDDDHVKVYMARIGGGLPAPRDPREACEGDGCQGDPGPRVERPGDPTESFTGPGDEDDLAPPFPANPSMTVKRLSRAAQRKLVRGRAVTLAVRSNARGRVRATTRFKVGRRWVRSSSAARTFKRAGTVRLTVRLSRAARRQLVRRGALRIRIDVVHKQVAKPRRLAFVLKQQAPARRGANA
ncbi:TolB family protein [Conexibacter arvalis]|uniref:WD40-like Beta Propeller Repeat n=1 Tax=Conexibacter arvalis TaxID=912552 RepID=A0A840IG21_9ACTN|nr:hypothetical protein [Conexibacter arvalis]MBB4663285.1 hypothetical protein [Conexibacter arvalis]